MICEKCGTLNEDNAKFCSNCGIAVDSETVDSETIEADESSEESDNVDSGVSNDLSNSNYDYALQPTENNPPQKTNPLVYIGLIAALCIGVLFLLGKIDIPFIDINRTYGEFKWKTNGSDSIRITGYTGDGGMVTIPATINKKPVTIIGDEAFQWKRLTSVIIPGSVIAIGENAFENNSLTSVNIPDNVTVIGNSAFRGNELKSINIPDSVLSIGNNAFKGNKLTSITIGENVSLADSSFDNNFEIIYDRTGKIAGTYIYNSKKIWSGATSYFKRGDEYYKNGDYINAILEYTQGLRFEQDDPDIYWHRGYSYSETGDHDRAIIDYTQVIRLNPKNASAYNNRGVAYEEKRNRTQAIKDYETAVQLDPSNTLYRNNLKSLRGW